MKKSKSSAAVEGPAGDASSAEVDDIFGKPSTGSSDLETGNNKIETIEKTREL